MKKKLEILSHRGILTTFRNSSLLQGQCRCISEDQRTCPYNKWLVSKPHLDFKGFAEDCFPKDHCKFLLAIGTGQVFLMEFEVALFPCALLALGCCSTTALGCYSYLLMTRCAVHCAVFTLICFSLSSPHRKGLEENKVFQTWV